ncbi:MAG: hypothetical protein RIC30_19890 [Marinoscillum sp.]|uniref:hypothetical protein n=1 Tax=Marinoscillum sp. TaxID=2024838 RepID=UPI0032F4A8AF
MKLLKSSLLIPLIVLCISCQTTESRSEESRAEEPLSKQVLEKNLEDTKEDLEKKIADLQEGAGELAEDARFQTYKAIEKLQAERIKVRRMIKRVKNTSEKDLKRVSKEAKEVYEDAGRQLDDIRGEFTDWLEKQKQ